MIENTWVLPAIWLGLALVATLLSIWLRIATALSEIVVELSKAAVFTNPFAK